MKNLFNKKSFVKIALLVVFLGGSMMPSVTFAQSAQGEGAAPRPGSPSQGSISQSNQNAVFPPSTPGTNTPLPKAGDPVIYSPTNNTTPSSQWCFPNIIACLKEGLTFLLSELSFAVLTISAYILGVAGLLLKFVIDYTVVNMSVRIDAVGTIDVAWTAFRDLANMLFIFIILYIAIGTILNLGSVSTKKMLVNVIIIGLLINFSLFFTKIIIDASNIVTIGFYNNIMVSDTGAGGWGEYGLAGPFVDKMQVVDIYDKKVLTSLGSDYKNILLLGLGGGLIFLVAAFIFLAISFLFIGRFIILVFLMILSPVAFASVALPEDKYSKMWWNKLLDQCIFAPVFMALLWVSLQLIGGILPDTTDKPGFAKALVGTNPVESLPIVMNFIIIIAMLLFCLLVAKQLGAMGASTAINAGNKIKSWGQGKVGRGLVRAPIPFVGSIASMDKKFAGSAFGNTAIGRTVRDLTTGAATGAGFGSGESVMSRDKKDKKEREDYAAGGVKEAEKGASSAIAENRRGRMSGHIKSKSDSEAAAEASMVASATSTTAQNTEEQRLQQEVTQGRALSEDKLKETEAEIEKHENNINTGIEDVFLLKAEREERLKELKAKVATTENIKTLINEHKKKAEEHNSTAGEHKKEAEVQEGYINIIKNLLSNDSAATGEEETGVYRAHIMKTADKASGRWTGGWGKSKKALVEALRDKGKGKGDDAEVRKYLAFIKKSKEDEAAGEVKPPKAPEPKKTP